MEKTDKHSNFSLRETVVIISGFAKSLFMACVILFFIKLGYEGFRIGEMGIMIGFFMIAILTVMIPLWILSVVVSIQLYHRKRWALILSIIITVLFLLMSFFSLGAILSMFLPVFFFFIIILCLEIRSLKSSAFQ